MVTILGISKCLEVKMMKIKILSIFFIIMLLMTTTGAADNPTVVITDYKVYPDVLMPGDVGTITITIKNTATVATQTDTTTSTYVGTVTTTTTTKNINADIQSVYLSGKGIEVISGNYGHLGELGPGQSTIPSAPRVCITLARIKARLRPIASTNTPAGTAPKSEIRFGSDCSSPKKLRG